MSGNVVDFPGTECSLDSMIRELNELHQKGELRGALITLFRKEGGSISAWCSQGLPSNDVALGLAIQQHALIRNLDCSAERIHG